VDRLERICKVSWVYCAYGILQDITQRKAHEEQIHLLMREVNHRAKNMLSLVQAIARQTAARQPEDFIGCFAERIQALAANQDLLIRNDCPCVLFWRKSWQHSTGMDEGIGGSLPRES
jgi:HWE histidine kinase